MRFHLPLLVCAAFAPLSWASAQTAPHDETVPHVHEPPKVPQDETPIEYMWRKSDDAFHAGDFERAIGLHKAIVALDPAEVESYSLGAWLLWSLGRPADAIEFLERGVKANPEDPEMWDAAGQQYGLQKRFADSANAFGKAVEFSGPKPDQMLRRRYAHASEHADNLAKSAEIWRALVAEFPNEAVNKNNLARVEKQAATGTNAPTTTAAIALGGAAFLTVAALAAPRVGKRVPGSSS